MGTRELGLILILSLKKKSVTKVFEPPFQRYFGEIEQFILDTNVHCKCTANTSYNYNNAAGN